VDSGTKIKDMGDVKAEKLQMRGYALSEGWRKWMRVYK